MDSHLLDQLRELCTRTIRNVSTPADGEILVEETRHLLAFIHGTREPVAKQLRFQIISD